MAKPGPSALPSNVHRLRGNASKKPLHELLDDFQPQVEIPDCPPHLWTEAKKEWKRITPLLQRYGLVSKIDRAALALYCQTWARWVWAEKMLSRAQRDADRRMREADARGEVYTGGDGLTMPTPGGHITYSPHWVIANKAMEQVHKFLHSFGMKPDARSAVTLSTNRQPELPFGADVDDEEPADDGFEDL